MSVLSCSDSWHSELIPENGASVCGLRGAFMAVFSLDFHGGRIVEWTIVIAMRMAFAATTQRKGTTMVASIIVVNPQPHYSANCKYLSDISSGRKFCQKCVWTTMVSAQYK